MSPTSPAEVLQAMFMHVRGNVQGRGVRPAVWRLATELRLTGHVTNTLGGVEIALEGPQACLDAFVSQLPRRLPKSAMLDVVSRQQVDVCRSAEFVITKEDRSGPLATCIPADIAICHDCLDEVADPADRRYGYPLISCVTCGPRYTIIRSMPFERNDTSMNAFPFCGDCQREYATTSDRRFHAQATSCPVCGPRVWFVDAAGDTVRDPAEVLRRAAHLLGQGKIVALRGLGGYQLLVDATNEVAVQRLRERKGRSAKPLAVMVASMDQANRLAVLDDIERDQLRSGANPIVLVRARVKSSLAPCVHPGLDVVGLMLPTTALHSLLLQKTQRPLVCTSGNREGDPLEVDPDQAEERLSGVADAWLHHDRPIARPLDDSVVRVIAGRPSTIRLARGLAPFPLDVSVKEPTLAVGGFLKSAIAWADGNQSALGPHIGDHRSIETRQRFETHIQDMQSLHRTATKRIVHDNHPHYYSTQWSHSSDLENIGTQHHHAHVVAGMLQHGWLDRTVMGVAWDGTGYGTDGTIWGGEFLVTRCDSFQRVGRLRPFHMPGGEIAIHQPWRVALAILEDALDQPVPLATVAPKIDPKLKSSIQQIIKRPQFSPVTTSAGRLFDAAAVISLGLDEAQFDGQPAMMLEAIADRAAEGNYEFPVRDGDLLQLDWRPLFAQLWADQRRGTSPATMAMRFHRSIAKGIVQLCQRRSDLSVILSGGVFQNRLLVELIWEMMNADQQRIGLPGLIPVNDGGLAAGQLAIAAAGENHLCV